MTEQQQILDALKKSGKPMRPGDIAESAGLEKEVVSKLIGEMKKNGLVDSPKKCFYQVVEK